MKWQSGSFDLWPRRHGPTNVFLRQTASRACVTIAGPSPSHHSSHFVVRLLRLCREWGVSVTTTKRQCSVI
jgi:fructose-1-phosphate kinase PfkB-like protein